MRAIMRAAIRRLARWTPAWRLLHFFYRVFHRFDLRGDLTDEEINVFLTERKGIMTWNIFTPRSAGGKN